MPVITPRLTGHNARRWSGITLVPYHRLVYVQNCDHKHRAPEHNSLQNLIHLIIRRGRDADG